MNNAEGGGQGERHVSFTLLLVTDGLSTISERELHANVLQPLCSADHQLGDGVQEVTQSCDQLLIRFRHDRREHEALFNKNAAGCFERFNLKATEGLKNSPAASLRFKV